MKQYIALALFCLSTTAIAGEVGIASSGDVSNNQAYGNSENGATNSTSDGNGQVSMDATPEVAKPNGAPNVTNASANVASAPVISNVVSDGIVYGLEAVSTGDTGVNLRSKAPATYGDRGYNDGGYVQMRSRNTPLKRPDLEFGILAGGSGSYIPVNESLIDRGGVDSPAKYRFHLSGEGFSGGASVGAAWRRGNHSFGAVVTGYLDSHTLKNYDHKNDVYSNDINTSITFLSRAYTLEFAAKAGHYFNDLHLYGKLGVICSAFQYKYRNPPVDSRKNLTAWGGVVGIGLQKPITLPVLQEAKIGIEYDYQLYESLRPVIKYGTHTDTSKLRPRYHNGYLTLSKTF